LIDNSNLNTFYFDTTARNSMKMEDNNNSRTFSANGIDIEDDVSTEEEDLMTTVKKNPKTAGSVTTTKKKTVVKSEKSAVTKKRKRRKQKPKDYPKRPLSAYNIFFKETRERILKQNGKTNFQDMVRKIAALWKEITPEDKETFDAIASKDLIRYKEEVGFYECKMVEKSQIENEEIVKKTKIDRDDESQNFRAKTENGIGSIAAATTTTGHDYTNGDNGTRAAAMSSNFRVQNVQIPSTSNDLVTQVPSNVAPSSHTLTINELDLARRRLEGELRAIEEAQSLRQRSGFGFGTPTADAATILRASSMYGEGAGEQFCANIAAAEQQIQRRNISNILDAGEDHNLASKDAEMIKRMALGLDGIGGDSMTTTINEIEMRKHLVGLGGDPCSTSNEVEIKKRLGMGKYPIIASKEEETRKRLLHEAEIRARFGMSENREEILGSCDEGDIRNRLCIGGGEGPMTASAEVDILKRLGLSNMADYQMATSAEAKIRNRMGLNGLIGNSTTVLDETEIRMRLGLEGDSTIVKNEAAIIRKQLSAGSIGDQLTPAASANDAELHKRLGMIQNQDRNAEHGKLLRDGSSNDASCIGRTSQAASRAMTMGMGITYEEKILAEERIRQQEILLAQISGSATSSLYSGLSGLGIPMSGGLGRIVPPYGGIGAPGSISSQSLTSAADVRMASIRSGMSVPLQRLTDEELRVLSSGREL